MGLMNEHCVVYRTNTSVVVDSDSLMKQFSSLNQGYNSKVVRFQLL